MMLVLMDLPSDYLLLEEVAEERSHETWNGPDNQRGTSGVFFAFTVAKSNETKGWGPSHP